MAAAAAWSGCGSGWHLAYEGRPLALPADRAFARIVERFAIPRALPEALLEGFAWDAEGRRYADLAGTARLCRAGRRTVGAMMAVLMGVRDPRATRSGCRSGCGDAAVQYCAGCRRGCAERKALFAAELAGGGRHRCGAIPGRAGAFRGTRESGRTLAAGRGSAYRQAGAGISRCR